MSIIFRDGVPILGRWMTEHEWKETDFEFSSANISYRSAASHIAIVAREGKKSGKRERGILTLPASLPSGIWVGMLVNAHITNYRNSLDWRRGGTRSPACVCLSMPVWVCACVRAHRCFGWLWLWNRRRRGKKTCWSPPVLCPPCPHQPPEEVIGRVCFPEIKSCSPHPQSWEKLAQSMLAVCSCNRPCHWHWERDTQRERGRVRQRGERGWIRVESVGEMLKGCILARYQKDFKKKEEEERKQWKKNQVQNLYYSTPCKIYIYGCLFVLLASEINKYTNSLFTWTSASLYKINTPSRIKCFQREGWRLSSWIDCYFYNVH